MNYAVAEVEWLRSCDGGLREPLRVTVLKPAAVDGLPGLWTLVLPVVRPIHPGDAIRIPVAPLVDEVCAALCPGCGFRIKEGARTVAMGRVISVAALEPKQGETPLQTLERAAEGESVVAAR